MKWRWVQRSALASHQLQVQSPRSIIATWRNALLELRLASSRFIAPAGRHAPFQPPSLSAGLRTSKQPMRSFSAGLKFDGMS